MIGFLIFIAIVLLILSIVHGFTLYKGGKELNNSNLANSGIVFIVIVGISFLTCAGVYLKNHLDVKAAEKVRINLEIEAREADASTTEAAAEGAAAAAATTEEATEATEAAVEAACGGDDDW